MERYQTLARRTQLQRGSGPRRRKPIRRVVEYTGPDDETLAAMLARDYNMCARCGIGAHHAKLDPQHRRPRGMGGTSDPDTNSLANLVPLCRICHDDVESHRTQAYDDGWLVRRGYNPAAIPVRHFRLGWAIPTPWGNYEDPPEEWVPGQLDLLDEL